MLLNLSDLSEGASKRVEISHKLSMPDNYNLADENIDIEFTGVIARDRKKYELSGTLTAAMDFCCDKCLEPVRKDVTAEVTEVFVPEGEAVQEGGEDFRQVKGSFVDLTESLRQSLVMNMPMQILCRDDCKGLCPYCGKNLNNESCSCKKPLDPRFEALRSLLKSEEV